MKCLITGARGFLGPHLVAAFEGCQVLGPSRSELNLLDERSVREYFKVHRPSHVVHAAGFVGGIGLHKQHPGRVATENMRMGLNVLEAAAHSGGCRVLTVSTVCIYPEHAPVPTPESSMHDGYPAPDTAAYGIVKKTLHTIAEALRSEFGLSHATVVPTNLYGPGDHYEEERSHVVPALVRRAHQAKEAGARELVVWGDGTQVRDLLYVADCASWMRAALESDIDGAAINLGSRVGTSIRDLAETICEVVGFTGELQWDATKPVGAPRRLLDVDQAERLLGFRPGTSLRDGLRSTYRDFLARHAQDAPDARRHAPR